MKLVLYLALALALAVVFLIRAELRGFRRQVYFFKPLYTLLVIGMALASWFEPAVNTLYTTGILGGLLFSLGGDIALMFQQNRRAFAIGLALFLVAQVV